MTSTHVNKNMNIRTKPCRNIINTGSCNRRMCTFAHSMSEWRAPLCRWDNNCRFFRTCRFKHSYESTIDWLKRTKQGNPNLPLEVVEYREAVGCPYSRDKRYKIDRYFRSFRISFTNSQELVCKIENTMSKIEYSHNKDEIKWYINILRGYINDVREENALLEHNLTLFQDFYCV